MAAADADVAHPAAAVSNALSRTMLPVRDWLVWGETYKAVLAADRAVDDAWRACRTPDALARRQAAVRSALASTSRIILKDHMEHCIVDAIEEHDPGAIEELSRAIDRLPK